MFLPISVSAILNAMADNLLLFKSVSIHFICPWPMMYVFFMNTLFIRIRGSAFPAPKGFNLSISVHKFALAAERLIHKSMFSIGIG